MVLDQYGEQQLAFLKDLADRGDSVADSMLEDGDATLNKIGKYAQALFQNL